MRLLLDTHVILWWLAEDDHLGPLAKEIIADPGNEAFVSAASVWEISIKKNLGKLSAPDNLVEVLDASGFLLLSIHVGHALRAGALPRHHDDPFDRMLIAQAEVERLTLVTQDQRLGPYGVPLVAADR